MSIWECPHLVSIWHSEININEFILPVHNFKAYIFKTPKKKYIILASRHCQSLEFFCRLYSFRIISIDSGYELEQKLLHGQKFHLDFATKTGTVATSITLDSNSWSEKLSSSTSVIIATTQSRSGNMFRGSDTAWTIFMITDTNSKGKHKLFELTPSGFRFADPAVELSSQGSKRPLYSRFLD